MYSRKAISSRVSIAISSQSAIASCSSAVSTFRLVTIGFPLVTALLIIAVLPCPRRKSQKPGFSRYFSSPNPKTRRNPVSWPQAKISETGFLSIFLVTQPKTHRNPVSWPQAKISETGFLSVFLVTQPKTHRNPVSRLDEVSRLHNRG